jgi:hypothetical protein
MEIKKLTIPLFAAAIYLLASGVGLAIETGEVQGKVKDEQGNALPGATVTAASPALLGVRTVFSTRNGDFRLPLLPVGQYTLNFQLEGFTPFVQENVIVRLGQVTSLTVIMKFAEIRTEIVVAAEAPLIDKTSSDTSFNLSSRDLEKIPVQNRTVVDVVKFAPGVTGVRMNTRRGTAAEGEPSFRGEGEEGNNWIVDGLSVSGVRLRGSGLKLNFDALDEIQIISDPFSPEFGSAYGGIINMVSKSGSNDLRGEFSLVFMDKNLQAARQKQLSVVSEPTYFSSSNWYLDLGGPVVKDKLWFFTSGNVFSDTDETKDGYVDYFFVPGGQRTRQNSNLFAKLTYSLSPNHTLAATGMLRKTLRYKGGIGIPDLFDKENFSDTMFRVNYKGIIDQATFIEAGLGQVRCDIFKGPQDENLGPAMYFIDDLAQSIHNSYGNVTDNERRLDASFKLTRYQETETFGNHEFAFGFEYYNIFSVFLVDFTGKQEDLFPGNGFDSGTKYYFGTWREGLRTPTFFYEYGLFNFTNSSRGIGIYFKDKVTFSRFSLMVGLRSQTQLNLDDQKEKLWSWSLADFLSPRLTLAIDITGDAANVLKLGWGRFSDLITTMPLGLFNSGAGLTFRTYRWQGTQNPSEGEVHNPGNWKFETEQKLQEFEVAPGIKPNFLTRYLVEFDRRLARNWALKARFIRTKAEKLLEILAVYDPVTTYKFLYDNFEYKRRNYWGIEVELDGRVGTRLFLNASYSHASAKGTNPGQTETGSWAQEEGSTNYLGLFGNHLYVPPLPGLEEIKAYIDWSLGGLGGRGIGDEGWYGNLPYSVDHNLKLNLSYLAPAGFTFSAALDYISGYYWEKLGYVPFFGGYYSFPEGRGSRKTPSHSYLDCSLEKSLAIGKFSFAKNLSLSVRLDVFNVLNSQGPISFVKENIPLFGEVWGRQQPRQARLMIKLKF